MVNKIVHSLRQLKFAGIEHFKMQRYYGFTVDIFAKMNDVRSYFLKKTYISQNHGFFQNTNGCLKEQKNWHIDSDLNAKLKRAKEFCKINDQLFERPPSITFISNFLPRHDKTSADFRLYNILKILLANNCKIEYVYCEKTSGDVRYKKAFEGDINFKFMPLNQQDFTKTIGEQTPENLWITSLWRIDYVRFMAQVTAGLRNLNSSLKIIIDTMDFHSKEFLRKYDLTNDPEDLTLANEFLELEKALYKAADTVVVISEEERKDIQEKIAGIRGFEIVPNIHEISNSTRPYNKRRNMCFVGHFGNKHNVDAVTYFIENIFQLILKSNPRVEFHVIGQSSEKFKKAFESPNVKVIGSLKYLQKALTYYKLFVCPMTYGAGMKGKISGAMAAGVPVVTTSIGAEGFPLRDGEECFIADSPIEFAEKCNQCLNDPSLWHNFAAKSRLMLAENFSPSVIFVRLHNILMN